MITNSSFNYPKYVCRLRWPTHDPVCLTGRELPGCIMQIYRILSSLTLKDDVFKPVPVPNSTFTFRIITIFITIDASTFLSSAKIRVERKSTDLNRTAYSKSIEFFSNIERSTEHGNGENSIQCQCFQILVVSSILVKPTTKLIPYRMENHIDTEGNQYPFDTLSISIPCLLFLNQDQISMLPSILEISNFPKYPLPSL